MDGLKKKRRSNHRFYSGKVMVANDVVCVVMQGYLEPNLKTTFEYEQKDWVPIPTPP